MNNYQYVTKDFPLDNETLLLQETLFHNANGYLGVRGNLEESCQEGYRTVRGQYVNGFYDFVEMPQAEKLCGLVEEKQTMLNVADTQTIEVYLEKNEKIQMNFENVENQTRLLDMKKGITVRSFDYISNAGKKLTVKITRMASFHILPLFLVKYEVISHDYEGQIKMLSSHIGKVMNYCNPDDPRVAGESEVHIQIKDMKTSEEVSYITSKTVSSKLQLTTAVYNNLSKKGNKDVVIKEEDGILEEQILKIGCNESIVLYKYSIFCDSLRYEDTQKSATEIMQNVRSMQPESLYQKQEEYLESFWNRCSIDVDGDEELNAAMHYNLYQLIQSVGKDDKCNIAAKGLSGEGYEGHYFWDTEMYIQPFFTLTANEISKNLIRYRYSILEHAKENAHILGHKKGAAFPWRTIMGKECSGYFPSGSAQYHISGDIAYSIIAYYLVTEDMEIMEECGLEILIETARLWMDLGNYYHDKFVINEVTGPDEYTCMVNNNYYTNALAKYNLYWAVKLFSILEKEGKEKKALFNTKITKYELEEFKNASEKMYLPYDEAMGINPQDDSFLQKKVWDIESITEEEKPLLLHYHPMYLYRYQICKQADTVLAHFILEDMQDIETMRKSFEYYEKVTTHDSSLSTCIFSIVASRLKMTEKAYQYFGESAKLDLFNTHKNTKDGIHTANMGGTYMAIVYGFGGLRIKESGVYLNPVLPKAWKGYQFRVCCKGSIFDVNVTEKGCKITLIKGKEITLYVDQKEVLLKDEIELFEG